MGRYELWSPSLLRTKVPSGRMVFEIQRERLVIDSESVDDLVSRLDELRQEVRMRRFASLSYMMTSAGVCLMARQSVEVTSLLRFSSSMASLSYSCRSE